MTYIEAYKYYTDKLAEHGWHSMGMVHINDLKDYINGGTEVVEMPSDETLGAALRRACESMDVDHLRHIEYARDLATEWTNQEITNA